MDSESFQNTHGASWARISADPAFFGALQVCDAESLKKLSRLSEAEIHTLGPVILAEFVGRLKLQNELLALAVPSAVEGFDLGGLETYADPEDPTAPQVTQSGNVHAPNKDFAGEFLQEEQQTRKPRGRPKGSKNKKK